MKPVVRRDGAPMIGIAGWKKSGKTTLTERLVEEFTRQDLKVATIKHAHHRFEIDDKNTDSARHRRAGATQVAIVSSRRWALVSELGDAAEPSLAEIADKLHPCDLIIVEGYKSAPIPKIEVRRLASAPGDRLSQSDRNVVAIAADHAVKDELVPVLDLNDIQGIAELIARTLRLTDRIRSRPLIAATTKDRA